MRIPQALCDISIHAPREGGDVSALNKKPTIALFQSTPPARGATCQSFGIKIFLLISIHAPREGGDGPKRRRHGTRPKFQSTPPARGATGDSSTNIANIAISIHAPREGGDGRWFESSRPFQISIHAPREGGDIEISKIWTSVL